MAVWKGTGTLSGKVGKERVKVHHGHEIPSEIERSMDAKVWNRYVESGWIDGKKKSSRSSGSRDGE